MIMNHNLKAQSKNKTFSLIQKQNFETLLSLVETFVILKICAKIILLRQICSYIVQKKLCAIRQNMRICTKY